MASILIVDDDASMTSLLRRVLELEGHTAAVAGDGREALRSLRETQHDLVVLDYRLPDATGDQVFRRIRQHSAVPVIMLSAVSEEETIVRSLDDGADDYVTKPFEPREFLARIRVVLRRGGRTATSHGKRLSAGSVTMDLDSLEVVCGGQPVTLTPTEFRLLQLFLLNVGRILTFDEIVRHCWSYDGGGNESLVRVHVSRLRKKLEERGTTELIRSQPRIGYGVLVR